MSNKLNKIGLKELNSCISKIRILKLKLKKKKNNFNFHQKYI